MLIVSLEFEDEKSISMPIAQFSLHTKFSTSLNVVKKNNYSAHSIAFVIFIFGIIYIFTFHTNVFML